MQKQLCQQLIKQTHFCIFAYKNCNARAAILEAGMAVVVVFLSNIFLAFFAFSIANIEVVTTNVSRWLYVLVFAFLFMKIVTREQQLQVYQTSYMYLFLFFIYKNCKTKIVAIDMSKQLHIFVFTFNL